MVDLSVGLMTPRDQKETLTKKFTLEISKTQCFINTSEELKGYNLWKYKKKTIIPNLILLSSLLACQIEAGGVGYKIILKTF